MQSHKKSKFGIHPIFIAMRLILLAIAPVIIIAVYIYIRDKYEREPLGMLLKALLAGALATIPIVIVNGWLAGYATDLTGFQQAGYMAFVVAATVEESFKFIALYLLVWRSKEFNEFYDGIVYGVFVSLGFALVENIMYVTSYGEMTGYTRAITAVPAHAIFGITMGYYFSFAKFGLKRNSLNMAKALIWPILLHGVYNFILMAGHPVFLLLFIPFLFYMWKAGFTKIRELSDHSDPGRGFRI